jgi:hypothetical protein
VSFVRPCILANCQKRAHEFSAGDFFAAGFRTQSNGLGRWYRTGHFFANGRQLTWEYPRATPDGNQIDLVEVMDVSGGLIIASLRPWMVSASALYARS